MTRVSSVDKLTARVREAVRELAEWHRGSRSGIEKHVATSALASAARTLSRDQFIARYAGLFLALPDNESESEIGFQTRVGSAIEAAPTASDADDDSGLEVLPLQKAAGNPYPDRISVGRARNCDIVLRHSSVSKLHAHFRVRAITDSAGAGFDLVDLDSHNGTKVNARVVPPHGAIAVQAGDTLHFGYVRVELMDAAYVYDLYHHRLAGYCAEIDASASALASGRNAR